MLKIDRSQNVVSWPIKHKHIWQPQHKYEHVFVRQNWKLETNSIGCRFWPHIQPAGPLSLGLCYLFVVVNGPFVKLEANLGEESFIYASN